MDTLFGEVDRELLLEWAMLSAVIGTGIYTSYTDLRFRLIRNWCTYGLLGVGLAGQVSFWVMGQTTPISVGLVLAGGLAVAWFLYIEGVWAPGDAKLYWGMVVAFPPTLCKETNLLSLEAPVGALVLNALLPNFLVLAFLLVAQRFREQRSSQRPALFRSSLWLVVETGGLLGLVLAVGSLVLARPFTFAEALTAGLAVFLLVDRFVARVHQPLLLLPGYALALYLLLSSRIWLPYGVLWATSWVILTIYQLLQHRVGAGFITGVDIGRLRPGMIPRLAIQPANSPEKQARRYVLSEKANAGALCQPGRPLQPAQVQRLQTLAQQGHFRAFENQVEVDQDLPFAPFLGVAVVMTTFFAGTPVHLLVGLVASISF